MARILCEKCTRWPSSKSKLLGMKETKSSRKTAPLRLTRKDLATINDFKRWWIRCSKCSRLAYMTPNWEEMEGECKCGACGGMYSIQFDPEYDRRFSRLPLWLRASFRGNIFWALNGEHLELLERISRSTLRERPVMLGRRLSFTMRMPFNLPSWILSAKNRSDLLRLIARLRATIPAEFALPRHVVSD